MALTKPLSSFCFFWGCHKSTIFCFQLFLCIVQNCCYYKQSKLNTLYMTDWLKVKVVHSFLHGCTLRFECGVYNLFPPFPSQSLSLFECCTLYRNVFNLHSQDYNIASKRQVRCGAVQVSKTSLLWMLWENHWLCLYLLAGRLAWCLLYWYN